MAEINPLLIYLSNQWRAHEYIINAAVVQWKKMSTMQHHQARLIRIHTYGSSFISCHWTECTVSASILLDAFCEQKELSVLPSKLEGHVLPRLYYVHYTQLCLRADCLGLRCSHLQFVSIQRVNSLPYLILFFFGRVRMCLAVTHVSDPR